MSSKFLVKSYPPSEKHSCYGNHEPFSSIIVTWYHDDLSKNGEFPGHSQRFWSAASSQQAVTSSLGTPFWRPPLLIGAEVPDDARLATKTTRGKWWLILISMKISKKLVGGDWNMNGIWIHFPMILGIMNNDPNWRSHIFQSRAQPPTRWYSILMRMIWDADSC